MIALAATCIAERVYLSYQRAALTDFDQVYVAARALIAGIDPYYAVRAGGFPFPLYYPATAGVITLPLAFLPLEWARAAFVGIGTGLCAWALSREKWYPLLALLSGSYWNAVALAQWSPLLLGAAFLPGWLAGAVLSAKPTVGLALVIGFWLLPSKRILPLLMGAAAVGVLSLALQPNWIVSWFEATRETPHIIPLVTLLPLGPVLLLALLRWRRPEARLLLALVCIPQTPSLYGTLILFLIPSTRVEILTLTLLADVATVIMSRYPQLTELSPSGLAERVHATGWILIALLHLPCLAMILRRPNEGDMPTWLNQLVEWAARGRYSTSQGVRSRDTHLDA